MERSANFFLYPILLGVCMLSSDVWSFGFVTSLLFLFTSYFSSCTRKRPCGRALFKLKPLRLILLLIGISTNPSQYIESVG